MPNVRPGDLSMKGNDAGASNDGIRGPTSPSSPTHRRDIGDNSSALSPVSPPYWVQSHQRTVSNISVETIAEGAITLQDNTSDEDTKNKACWARSVHIEDHVVIRGNKTGIGAFVIWNINVETLQVCPSGILYKDTY